MPGDFHLGVASLGAGVATLNQYAHQTTTNFRFTRFGRKCMRSNIKDTLFDLGDGPIAAVASNPVGICSPHSHYETGGSVQVVALKYL